MNILALIPARAGSKGIIDKNIQLLWGYPLLAWSIIASKNTKDITRTIVSTDSEKYAKIAEYYGAEIIMRPEKFATDNSGDIDWLRHALNLLMDNEKYEPDYIVHLRPTSPIREIEKISEAINKFIEMQEYNYTSLRSVHPLNESPYKMYKFGGFKELQTFELEPYMWDGDWNLLNRYKKYTNEPRQKHPTAYLPNGYVDILIPEIIEHRSNNIHGDKIYGFETEPIVEIDSINDLLNLQSNKFPPINSTYAKLLDFDPKF